MKRAALFLLCLLLFLSTASADPIDLSTVPGSCFMLQTYINDYNRYQASGFLYPDSNHLVTCYHVIDVADYVEAEADDGTKYTLDQIIAYDKDADVAILKIDAPYPALPRGASISLGQDVYLLSSPMGIKNILSKGIVSREIIRIPSHFGYDATSYSGSSGGAILSTEGVVGVNYGGYAASDSLDLSLGARIDTVDRLLENEPSPRCEFRSEKATCTDK